VLRMQRVMTSKNLRWNDESGLRWAAQAADGTDAGSRATQEPPPDANGKAGPKGECRCSE